MPTAHSPLASAHTAKEFFWVDVGIDPYKLQKSHIVGQGLAPVVGENACDFYIRL